MRNAASLATVLAVALLGCGAAENTAEGTKYLASEAGQGITDRSITFAVKTSLIDDDMVEAGKVDVDTSDGVVTLNGTQPSEEARARAEQLAARARGVHRVVNNLSVSTPPAPAPEP
jgi:hyperosmotically inducible periplasmic protein